MEKLILSLALIFQTLLFIACTTVKYGELSGVKISRQYPIIGKKGELIRYDTFSTSIYKYKDQVLYQAQYHYDSIFNGISIISENRDYFFVFRKGNAYGLLFDPNKQIFGQRIQIDSTLKKEWCNEVNFYHGFMSSNMHEITNREKNKQGETIKSFSFQSKKDTILNGTAHFWFSKKMNHIDYSLSRELDSIYKMKLYKIKIMNNAQYFVEYKYKLDPIEQYYLLEEIADINKQAVMKYFNLEKN